MGVSIVILTFNEADNIERCLRALSWCDDIWVIDSFSTDGTEAIAKALGVNVIQRGWLSFADQRNFALDHLPLRNEWVLHLDADEYVTSKLAAVLSKIADDNCAATKFTAYEVPFRMLFMGRWLRYGGTCPNCQVRFGRKDALRFVQIGHGQREKLTHGLLGRLNESIFHFNFSKGIGSWITKHAVYARDEAKQAQNGAQESINFSQGLALSTRLRRKIKYFTLDMPGRPLLRFFYMYVLRLGFLDGRAGFHYCLLVSIYEYFTVLQRREVRVGRDAFQESKINI